MLFAAAIELFAEAIRNSPDIFGIKMGQNNIKIALYADDVLLFVSNPERSIPAILSITELLGLESGYKVNLDKSVAMTLGGATDPPFITNFPFRWSATGLSYLGITVSTNLKDLFKLNFLPVLKKI